jgi:spore germination cell wall hydrolase CwlJ-like protein
MGLIGALAGIGLMAATYGADAGVTDQQKSVEAPRVEMSDAQPVRGAEPRDEIEVLIEKARKEDVDYLAATMWAEARGTGVRGMRAVGHVIYNRARADNPKRYGQGIKGVVLYPSQFSCWKRRDPNYAQIMKLMKTPEADLSDRYKSSKDYQLWLKAQEIAGDILDNTDDSPVGNSTYFHTVRLGKPHWTKGLQWVANLGGHTYYRERM